jgi:DNA polymerase-3 subunit epsilon
MMSNVSHEPYGEGVSERRDAMAPELSEAAREGAAGAAADGLSGARKGAARPIAAERAGNPVDDDRENSAVPLAELDYAVIDVETTGFSPEDSAITEVGAVRVRGGQPVAEFTSLVNPGIPVPASIEALTGIDDEMLRTAPPVAAVLPGLLAFADGCVLAAHNARFDVGFLTAACAAAGLPWPGFAVIDTVRLARHLMVVPDEVPDRKLGTLADFFGTTVAPAHRALADARATADILMRLVERLAGQGVTTMDELTAWLAERDAAEEAAPALAARAREGRRWRRWLARALRWLGRRRDTLRAWLPRLS